MGKKAKVKAAPRKPNFPLLFWEGLKDRAQAVADAEYGGNLTTFLNATVQAAVKKFEGKRSA